MKPVMPLAWIRRAWFGKRVVGSGTTSNPAARTAAAVVVSTVCAVSRHFRDPGNARRTCVAASWGVPPTKEGNAWWRLLDVNRREAQILHASATNAVHYGLWGDVLRSSKWHRGPHLVTGVINTVSILSWSLRESYPGA